MLEKTLTYLDFPKLLDLYKRFAFISETKDLISSIRPLKDAEKIKERLNKTEEMLNIISTYGRISLEDVSYIRDLLKKLSKENSVFEIEEFLQILRFIEVSNGVIEFFKRIRKDKALKELTFSSPEPLTYIYSAVRKRINPQGFIEDTASLELMNIRAELIKLRERIKRRLEQIMEREDVRAVVQDFYITLRNGRYVIPLKPNFNQFFQGIVHDYSYSLKTSFVEPLEVVELNNQINLLTKAEKEEERRILFELTEILRKEIENLKKNYTILKELDFYQSLALFNLEFSCVKPSISDDGALSINSAINPFLFLSKKEGAVPIDIHLEKGKKAMIISGPNAGGKTVALKTIGLFTLMALSGLFIPAKGNPRIPLFSSVYALIGDEQDIFSDLSSFTSHMSLIRDFYEASRGGELILIDEIGGPTDPKEASSLAMAIIDAFVEKDCKVIVTTHSNFLKGYGQMKDFAINVATAFDREKMTPLYFLQYGEVGSSNAIKIAERIGLQEKILKRSYEYMESSEQLLSELLNSLREEKRRLEEEKNEIKRLKEELKRKIEEIKRKKRDILEGFEEKMKKKILEVEEELENIRRELKKKERPSLHRSKENLRELKRHLFGSKEEEEKERIKVGDLVRLKLFDNRMGSVVEEMEEEYVVMVDNFRIRMRKDLVEKVESKESIPSKSITISVERPEEYLNVRGMRVEEAIEVVEKFIDGAMVHGIEKVKILHGIGTGRLMNAIREHLRKMSFVKGVKADEKNPGITIVELQ